MGKFGVGVMLLALAFALLVLLVARMFADGIDATSTAGDSDRGVCVDAIGQQATFLSGGEHVATLSASDFNLDGVILSWGP